jgi:basic membrane protein A
MSNKAISQVQSVAIVAIIVIAVVLGGSAYYISTIPQGVTTVTETRTSTVTGGTTTVTQTTTQTTTQTVTTTSEPGPITVAVVYTASPDVRFFDEAMKLGLDEAKELYGIEYIAVEFVTLEERERSIRTLAGQGVDLIFNHESTTYDQMVAVANDFPDTWFVSTMGAPEGETLPPNVADIAPATLDGQYLAGVLAGSMTETNKIGAPVGFMFPWMAGTYEAFKLGAKSVNPEAQVFLIETFSWLDAVKGKEASEALIDQGCDFLVHQGGAMDVGIIQAAEENDLMTTSVSPIDNTGFSNTNLATATFRFDLAATHMIGLLVTGQLENKIYTGGLLMGWSDLTPFEHPEWIPDDVAGMVYKARNDILSGEIVVPFIPELTDP